MELNKNKKIRKITSPVRKEKIEEGQKTLKQMGDKSPLEKIYQLFLDRTTAESGFSIRELALLFFPKHARINPQTGNPTPTLKGIDLVYALLNAFRKSIFNKSVVLFTYANLIYSDDKRELCESILYRKTTIREFEDTRQKLKKIMLGLEETIEHALEIFAQTPEEIKARDLEFEKALRASRHRKRSSSDEDADLYK